MVYSFWQEYISADFFEQGSFSLSLVQIMVPNTRFIFIESSIYLRNYHLPAVKA